MKKLAVIASGWHFPSQFYEAIANQKKTEGWEVDLFCISHRHPSHAFEEKKDDVFADDLRGKLDKKLYERIITIEEIEKLGWDYKECPNTIGDWGNTNQWLETHDYKEYDLFLFTHDDNLILTDEMFNKALPMYVNWDIMCNSTGMPKYTVRGSFEFFRREVLDAMGGKFDDSSISLKREGVTTASKDIRELYDWNHWTDMIMKVIEENKFRMAAVSPWYRVSPICIEGERGYISATHGINTAEEEEGLRQLQEQKII